MLLALRLIAHSERSAKVNLLTSKKPLNSVWRTVRGAVRNMTVSDWCYFWAGVAIASLTVNIIFFYVVF